MGGGGLGSADRFRRALHLHCLSSQWTKLGRPWEGTALTCILTVLRASTNMNLGNGRSTFFGITGLRRVLFALGSQSFSRLLREKIDGP